MAVALPDPPLLVISDRSQARRPLLDIAAAVFAAGGRWFSLREKDLGPAERRESLAALVALGNRFGARVTAHEDTEAVLATGAAGVHLPSGAHPAAVRQMLPQALVGASAHSAEEAAALLRAGAHYVTISPIFLTASKPGYGPAIGLDGLRQAAVAAAGPVIALGGIDESRIAPCLAAGAAGIAVMGEVMRSPHPAGTVRELLRAIAAATPR